MKALASDLDGTLVFNGTIKESDLEAIRKFQAAGNLFGICTGRGASMCHDLEGLNPDFSIVSSGANIIVDGKTIYDLPIDFQDVEAIYCDYEQFTEFVIIQMDDSCAILKKDMWNVPRIENINEIKEKRIYDISLIFKDEDITEKVGEMLKDKYPHLSGHQNGASIDIVDARCSKGNAVEQLKQLFHVETTGGIGDSYNDITMIKQGDYGFTFHNSPERVKKEADYLVSSVEEAIEIMMK